MVYTYFINTYSANKMGVAPTVESASVPHFSLEEFPQELRNLNHIDMIKLMGKGILVTGFNGGNCNPVTGDFSFGIEGFAFKQGKVVHPVKEMLITGNIMTLWNSLIAAGSDARPSSRWQVPSLAFDDVSFSA